MAYLETEQMFIHRVNLCDILNIAWEVFNITPPVPERDRGWRNNPMYYDLREESVEVRSELRADILEDYKLHGLEPEGIIQAIIEEVLLNSANMPYGEYLIFDE